MNDLTILYNRMRKPITASERWLDRAVRARKIAMMHSNSDAKLVEAYAVECDAKGKLIEEQKLPLTA